MTHSFFSLQATYLPLYQVSPHISCLFTSGYAPFASKQPSSSLFELLETFLATRSTIALLLLVIDTQPQPGQCCHGHHVLHSAKRHCLQSNCPRRAN